MTDVSVLENPVVIGDSISFGQFDAEVGGWVTRLRLKLEAAGHGANVYNLGINGDTSDGVLARLDEVWRRDPTLLLVAIGINDSRLEPPAGEAFVPIERYAANLEAVAVAAKERGVPVVFVGVLPICEHDMVRLPGGSQYFDHLGCSYDQIARQTAERNGCGFIDVASEARRVDWRALLSDGLHPNSEGHEVVADVVCGWLLAWVTRTS
ncbi:MAG: hypothetical protein CSA64_05275 [Arachnia propionica]|nr:MAG: hypothetical protein CSA64_05275 [Arachnia propionica]